jgi:hypothetical protein
VVDDCGGYLVDTQAVKPIVPHNPRPAEPQQPLEHLIPGVSLVLLHAEAQAGYIVQENHLYPVFNAILKQPLLLIFLALIEDDFGLRQLIVGHQVNVLRWVLIQQQQFILHGLNWHFTVNVQRLPGLSALSWVEVFFLADGDGHLPGEPGLAESAQLKNVPQTALPEPGARIAPLE